MVDKAFYFKEIGQSVYMLVLRYGKGSQMAKDILLFMLSGFLQAGDHIRPGGVCIARLEERKAVLGKLLTLHRGSKTAQGFDQIKNLHHTRGC